VILRDDQSLMTSPGGYGARIAFLHMLQITGGYILASAPIGGALRSQGHGKTKAP